MIPFGGGLITFLSALVIAFVLTRRWLGGPHGPGRSIIYP
jgi:hypothetical protein